MDFITNTGVLAGISLVFVVIYFLLVFRKDLTSTADTKTLAASMPSPKEAITNKKDFAISSVIFVCACVLLVTHAQTGLTVAFIGSVIAAVTLITSGKYALKLLKKVDYKTLLFFVKCFVLA